MKPSLSGEALAKSITLAIKEYALLPSPNTKRPELSSFLRYEQPTSSPSSKPLCAKRIAKKQQVAQCLDCGLCPNSIICLECFGKSDHEGHRFKIIRANGGSCDCGDVQVWRQEGFCCDHTGIAENVQIPKETMEQFLEVWRCLFSQMFATECPIVGDSKVASLMVESYCEVLIKLAQGGAYFCQLITTLLESEILISDRETGNKVPNILIDALLMYVGTTKFATLVVDLLIGVSLHKESKKVVYKAYLRTYEHMFLLNSEEYLGLGCQLFTHEDIVQDMVSSKVFLTLKSTTGAGDSYDKAARHLYNLNYIVHSKKAGREYWQNFFNSDRGFEEMAVHWKSAEEDWNGDYSDKSQIDSYSIEKQFVTLVGKICVAVQHEELHRKAVVRLLQYIEKQARQVKNKCYLPLHRALSVAILSSFNFDIRRVDEKSWLHDLLTPEITTILLKPVIECVAFNNMLLHRTNLRVHYQAFVKRYAEGGERIYAYDVVLVKALILAAPECIETTRILPSQALKFLNCENHPKEGAVVEDDDDEIRVEDFYSLADILAFFCEISLHDSQHLFVRQEIFKNSEIQVPHIDNTAEDVIASYLTRIKQSSIEEIKKVAFWLLHSELSSLMDIIKSVSVFDKATQRFSAKEKVETINFDYFYDRLEFLKIVRRQESKPNYKVKSQIRTQNQKIFCTLITEKLLVQLEKMLVSLNGSVKNIKMVAALNYFLVQLCKLYEVGNKCEGFGHLPTISKLLNIEWTKSLLTPQTIACLPEALNETHSSSASPSQPKRDVKEIQRRRMEEMRAKQKAFAKTLVETNQTEKVEGTVENEDCCSICKSGLDKSMVAYPIGVQLSNLSGLVKQQQGKSEVYYTMEKLGKDEAIPTVAGGLVFSSCYHSFHWECLVVNDADSCSICKRRSKAYMIHSKDAIPKELLHKLFRVIWRTVNPGYFGNNATVSDIIKLVADSLVESIGYNATFHVSTFTKNKLRVYRDLTQCLQSYLFQLEPEQKKALETYLFNDLKTQQKDFLRQAVYGIIVQSTSSSEINVAKLFECEKGELEAEELLNLRVQEAMLVYLFCHRDRDQLTKSLQEIPQSKKEYRGFQFRNLPDCYSPLHSFRKSCPKCHKLSAKICICLMCNWMGCSGCTSGGLLGEHTANCHVNTSLFLWLETGKFVVMSQPKATLAGSAYRNEFGEEVDVMNKNLEEFKLDSEAYLKVQKIIQEGEAPVYIDQNRDAGREYYNSDAM